MGDIEVFGLNNQRSVISTVYSDVSELVLSPLEVNNFFVRMLHALMSKNRTALAVIVEEAHYCDELSWEILQEMQVGSIKLVLLLTLQQVVESPMRTRRGSGFGGGTSVGHVGTSGGGGAFGADHKRSSTGSFATTAEEKKLSSNDAMRRCVSEARAVQAFVTSPAYENLIANPSTTMMLMLELDEAEVADVLRHVLGDDVQLLPEIVRKILQMSAGNAFWCKAIARYIKENGICDFLETTARGHNLDPLKNLILCRLEKVSTEQQMVMRYASVIGEEFSVRTLSAVVPRLAIPKLKRSLAILIEMGFIYCIESAPLAIYGFHNQLTRESIYEIIPPRFNNILSCIVFLRFHVIFIWLVVY